MGKTVGEPQPCLDTVNCGSSDARRLFENGTSFCFSCKKTFSKEETEKGGIITDLPKSPSLFKKTPKLEDIKKYSFRGLRTRNIVKAVAEFYKVRVSYNEDGEVDTHYYPYEDEKAFKVRTLPKSFTWVGKSEQLFGRERFTGGGKRLVICEGEVDTLSVAQAHYVKYGKIYPCVGLSSSVMTKAILANREWIRSFAEVVICFDMDAAGEKATAEAIKFIGVDKVKIAKLPRNDANDTLIYDGDQALMQCIFDAEKYVPAGIIKKDALWKSVAEYNSIPSLPYPACIQGVNTKLKGRRGGEITLFISGTGSGKSTVLREIMLDTLENTTKSIGIISLEEGPPDTARKLSGMKLMRNPANEEIPMEDLKVGFDQVFGDDRVILLDHQGSMNDTSIVDQIEYMILSGCEEIYIDHITIMVSEGIGDLSGNEAQDKVMNDLLRLVKRYPTVWIGLVSHLRKANNSGKPFEEGRLPSIDDIRGSGSIKQISFDIIAFARNLTAEDEHTRNLILMRILKSRYTGLTGDIPGARYNNQTGRLEYAGDTDNNEFNTI